VEWKVKYEPGAIEARGSKTAKVVLTEKRETTGPAVAIRLTADRTEINADGEDVAVLTVEALDKEGRSVPTAGNLGLQSLGRWRADRRGQRRPQLPGERQGAQALALQWPRAGHRAIHQAREGEIQIEAVKEGWDGPELTPAKLHHETS
jgi:beta-galactosidase